MKIVKISVCAFKFNRSAFDTEQNSTFTQSHYESAAPGRPSEGQGCRTEPFVESCSHRCSCSPGEEPTVETS